MTAVVSTIGCGVLYHQVGEILDFETKPTLTRDELFKKADSYANMLGVDIERSFKQYRASNNAIERFAMQKIHNLNDLTKKQQDGTYHQELFSIVYSDYGFNTENQNEIVLTDQGGINGFNIQKELLKGSPENVEAELVSMIELFVPDFTKQYKQIGVQSTSNKETVSITQIADAKKTEDVQVSSAILWEKLFFNSTDSKYVVFGTQNGQQFYFKQFNPVPDAFIKQAEHAQFVSKLLGMLFFICTILLIMIFILLLRKHLPKRDTNYSSRLALLLAVFFSVNSITDYYYSLPVQPTQDQYLKVGALLIGTLLLALIAFYILRILFKLAEAITRAARPQQIPVATSVTSYVLTSYQGMNQLLAGYLFIPIILCFTMAVAWLTIKSGWIVIPVDNYSFLSFSKAIFVSLQAAVIEESLFRGILLGGMLWYINRLKKMRLFFTFCAVLLQAVLFAGVHNFGLNSPAYAHLVLLLPAGVIFGLIYLQYGLFTAALTHALYDMLLLTLHQTNPYYVTILTGFVLLAPFILLITRVAQTGRLHSLTEQDLNAAYHPNTQQSER